MMNEQTTLIHNVFVVNEGRSFLGHVTIKGEMIARVAEGDPDPETLAQADNKIDGAGRLLLPGVIDTHVHFRDPGLTHKADMATESRAAVYCCL